MSKKLATSEDTTETGRNESERRGPGTNGMPLCPVGGRIWQTNSLLFFPLFFFSKLPSWARAVVPKIFYVTEKAWNYYPYTITGKSSAQASHMQQVRSWGRGGISLSEGILSPTGPSRGSLIHIFPKVCPQASRSLWLVSILLWIFFSLLSENGKIFNISSSSHSLFWIRIRSYTPALDSDGCFPALIQQGLRIPPQPLCTLFVNVFEEEEEKEIKKRKPAFSWKDVLVVSVMFYCNFSLSFCLDNASTWVFN